MFDQPMTARAAHLLDAMRHARLGLVTAESCTGGLIAGLFTEIAGSSDVVDRGFVTYSNEAKTEVLGVPADMIGRLGAVSRETAIAMAEGALARASKAKSGNVAIAVTGIAGPGGGSAAKPVGLVHIAAARSGHATRHRECRFGDSGRSEVRLETCFRGAGPDRGDHGDIDVPEMRFRQSTGALNTR